MLKGVLRLLGFLKFSPNHALDQSNAVVTFHYIELSVYFRSLFKYENADILGIY